MKEFYAEECGQDYGVLCYQEQIRQSVTKELLEEILNVMIIKFEIYFEEGIIEYTYNEDNINFTKEITINNFIKACNE
jgi:hypothetical protein